MATDTKKPSSEVAEMSQLNPMSLADLFAAEMDAPEIPSRVTVPPAFAPVARAARTKPVPKLTGLAPFWVERGRGGTAKTTVSRYFASELFERQVGRFILAAMDPGVRLLAEFAQGVMQPPSTNYGETLTWLRGFFNQVRKHRVPGVLDTGGGDTAFPALVRSAPTLAQDFEEAGVGLVAAYFFSTAPDDPAMLGADVAAGFTPRATALVLSMHLADNPRAFNAVRAHPDYKAALDRGAVEIIIPRLEPQELANRIEARRLHFFQARDGIVPKGNPHPPIDAGMDRVLVREWLEKMAEELRPVREAGWLPWGDEA